MPHWKSEQLECLLAETDERRVFKASVSLIQQLGMEYLSFSTRIQLATRPPLRRMMNNYPAVWNERYRLRNYSEIDPTVTHCHNSLMPILWSDQTFTETPEFWEDAKAHGLRHGWAQSVHDPHRHESMLSVARSQHRIEIAEFYDKADKIMWLCHTLHTVLVEKYLSHNAPCPQLTCREKEVLKWSAAGKTAADIACILAISQSTVNFHVRSIINKLDTNNKAAAIAIALSRGLI